MSSLPARRSSFLRSTTRFATSCWLLSALFASSAAAAPTLLQYDFDETNSAAPIIRLQSSAAFSGVPLSSSSTSVEIALSDWAMPQLVSLSENRQSVSFSPSVLSMQGAAIGGNGEFDLGFSGRVPYAVSISSLSVDSLGSNNNPLAADASFRFARLAFTTFRIEGSVDLLGATIPFSVTKLLPNGTSDISGRFTPSSNPEEIDIAFSVGGLRDGVQILDAMPHAGFELGLSLRFVMNGFAANPTVVPEPGSALLIGLGLIVLGAVRRP